MLEPLEQADTNAALLHIQQVHPRIGRGQGGHDVQGAVLRVAVGHQYVQFECRNLLLFAQHGGNQVGDVFFFVVGRGDDNSPTAFCGHGGTFYLQGCRLPNHP